MPNLITRFITDDFTSLTDGVRKSFPLSRVPLSGTEQVSQNGLIQDSGYDRDYVIIKNSDGKYTLWWTESAPSQGDRLTVKYQSNLS